MKRLLWIGSAALLALLAAQTVTAPRPMSELVPAGAVLYLETKNLAGLVADWNGSAEKTAWLGSANYQVFSRSKLFGRLEGVFNEYATGIGVRPDMDLLGSVAGAESALAVYDINKIEFLYVTKLASARAMETALWKARTQFTQRNAAGAAYYVKTEGQSKRVAAFAVSGDWLLVATKEDALTGALSLLARGTATPVAREPWFDAAVRAGGAAGDLRMVMNLPRLAASPAFRTYWVQRNAAELRGYQAAVSDLRRSAAEYKEDRVLLRESGTAPDAGAVAGLSALVPASAGLYRVWAQPSVDDTVAVIRRKITSPGVGNASGSVVTGEDELEAKVDDAPFDAATGGYREEPLRALIASNAPRAVLHVQTGRTLSDGVFVGNDAAVVVEGANDWNQQAVRTAVTRAVESLYATQGFALGGLARVHVAARGKRLFLATRQELLDEVMAAQGSGVAGVSYAASYKLTGEAARFRRVTEMIERSDPFNAQSAEPRFFSENLASLADTMKRVQSVDVRQQDAGATVKQTVTYRLAR